MRLYDVIRNAFILTSTHFGPMIVNRLDYGFEGNSYSGVGADLLEQNEYNRLEIDECFEIIKNRYERFGKGVMVLDIGANVGPYTLGWAHRMHNWGCILAIEAQERLFYALAGNIVLNNCFNAQAMWAAVTSKSGSMIIPEIDVCSRQANFGGLCLADVGKTFDIESYDIMGKVKVPAIAIDDLKLSRLDFIKIDVQGMELDVLKGAKETIARCRPEIVIEENFSPDEYCSVIPNYTCRKFSCLDYLMEPLNPVLLDLHTVSNQLKS